MTAEKPHTRFIKTAAEAPVTIGVTAVDETGAVLDKQIACERPLTLYLNWRPIVTLMTLGARPEALALGYMKNQGFIKDLTLLESVIVDWEVNSAALITEEVTEDLDKKLSEKTVTTGCGQGTVFGNQLERLDRIKLAETRITQSTLYSLLHRLATTNTVYRNAGAVHSCALCSGDQVLAAVEDVGRHNAVDTLAGQQWLNGLPSSVQVFYTTGRITSEMVIKVAQMGVPILLSRSGITQMGLELGQRLGVTLIARAKGRHFLIFNGAGRIALDQTSEQDAPKI